MCEFQINNNNIFSITSNHKIIQYSKNNEYIFTNKLYLGVFNDSYSEIYRRLPLFTYNTFSNYEYTENELLYKNVALVNLNTLKFVANESYSYGFYFLCDTSSGTPSFCFVGNYAKIGDVIEPRKLQFNLIIRDDFKQRFDKNIRFEFNIQ